MVSEQSAVSTPHDQAYNKVLQAVGEGSTHSSSERREILRLGTRFADVRFDHFGPSTDLTWNIQSAMPMDVLLRCEGGAIGRKRVGRAGGGGGRVRRGARVGCGLVYSSTPPSSSTSVDAPFTLWFCRCFQIVDRWGECVLHPLMPQILGRTTVIHSMTKENLLASI